MPNFIEDAYLNSLTENLIQNLAANAPLEKWIESDYLKPHLIITPDNYPAENASIIAPNSSTLPTSDLLQANSLSQDRINALLGGSSWTLPTSRVLTYSFYESSVWNGTYYGSQTGVTEVSEAVKTNIRQILNSLETVIDVDFQEVNETSTTAPVGKLRYMLSNGPSYAYAYYPSSNPLGGDVHLKPSYQNNSNTNGFERTAGNHGYMALIHETLHGLGLKHPHENPALATVEDNTANTVMSYRFTGNSSGTAMAYDIAALQYLYGTKAKETGDTSYQFTTRIDQFSVNGILSLDTTYLTKQTIWDTNGSDTLDFSTLAFENLGYRLDMNQGGWLTANRAYHFQQSISDSNVTGGNIQSTYFDFGTSIAYNVTLENLVNSTSADTIYANDAANTFRGYTNGRSVGADVLWNTNSNDTLDLSAYSFNAVTRTQSGNDLVLGLENNGSITVKNYYINPQLNVVYSNITLPTITLEIASSSVAENGTPNLIYTFTRTGDFTNALTVNFSVDGTATWNTDYTSIGGNLSATVGSLIFGANSTTATLTIDPKVDTIVENNETIGLTLTSSIDYTIGTLATITGTITNDDGDALDNTLVGGSGKDTLDGKEGNDTLIGGNSNDRLTGGSGLDHFVFASLANGIDRIVDFKVVDDTIELSAAGFGGGLSVGIPDASLLQVGAEITSANTAAQRLIFNTTTGALFFDADGNGTLAHATQFATLSTQLALTTADFLVV